MTKKKNHPQWVEKYRPQSLADLILPERLASILNGFVERKNIPNLLLYGPPGSGKTSTAQVLVRELAFDTLFLNGAENSSVAAAWDAHSFAVKASFEGARKVVVFDEADSLTKTSAQAALRGIVEEVSSLCSFIFICNDADGMIPALRSRCSNVEYGLHEHESSGVYHAFIQRVTGILKAESVKYDSLTLERLTAHYFPDWRRVLNELQAASVTGRLIAPDVAKGPDVDITFVLEQLKLGQWQNIKAWISLRQGDASEIFHHLYQQLDVIFTTESIGTALATISRYDAMAAAGAAKDLCIAGALAELRRNCQFR